MRDLFKSHLLHWGCMRLGPWRKQSQPCSGVTSMSKFTAVHFDLAKRPYASCSKTSSSNFFFFYFVLLYNTVLVLPYIDMNLPRVYMNSQSWTPLPLPTPYHLSGSSLCTSPKHPLSCIKHRLVIHFLHDSIHVSVPFSQIIPPSPSPSESKIHTSVSLLLSHIQGYHYHLSKFHIYALVYCIGVFLSGLLHSV